MTVNYNLFFHDKIRLSHLLSLIFFALAGSTCKQTAQQEVSIIWSGKQATGIFIPGSLTNNKQTGLQVFLQHSRIPMLGECQPADAGVIFKPLVPLSPARQYEVFLNNKQIARLAIPPADTADAPELTAIYPSGDTVPENLLKIYLQFSSPMQEGQALQHIYLLGGMTDTIPNVFLDLQPELWNEERTTLTVWLDPGRIKRGLIPNQRLGNPLKLGSRYTLLVTQDWKNTQGLAMRRDFKKNYTVKSRDDTSPQINQWEIILPKAQDKQPLQIEFIEPLDYFLAKETIQITNEKGVAVDGWIELVKNEEGLNFYPAHTWQAGYYRIRVAAILEDLAGNNLNKPFDRDVLSQQKKDAAFVQREFEIKH